MFTPLPAANAGTAEVCKSEQSIASVKIHDIHLFFLFLFLILFLIPFSRLFAFLAYRFASRPANEPGGAYKTVYDTA